ncbi:AAA family ATPase [Empedobacter sp. R132-2]|uniref:AAA family ATPase n=1 Tax=Empedobacter sp. R132-2 TaxID=2746740 RepID=UPI002577EEFF|nr:AAA family ATPase [Empedobacter sp. R132-2]MDM1137822.1 AAA family ATPase [Empedobacter sp. R132-2]
MLITRIAAKNYKTYKDLDLDLNVNPEQPIILIGGQNGGGKTTLFKAIYSALYGLEIKNEDHFKRLINASVEFSNDLKIELEIDFKGKVLNQDYFYKIKRVYALNPQSKPVESVSLNFNGDTFTYGTAMPISQRAKMEAEVNKIIKANLPKELSKYFLFDAMESGNILKEDYLSRVIKENIENVMGFNKYSYLKDATIKVKEKYISESIGIETEREEYKNLVDSKDGFEQNIKKLNDEYQSKLGYSINNKELYNKAKHGLNLQKEYQERIQFLQNKIEDLKGKQAEYLVNVSKFTNDIEIQVFLPKTIDSIREELQLILAKNDSTQSNHFNQSQLEIIESKLSNYIALRKINVDHTSFTESFIDYLKIGSEGEDEVNPYNYFSNDELDTIRLMLNQTSINSYSYLMQSKESLENELNQLPTLRAQLEEAKSHLTADENSIINTYESNEARLAEIKEAIKNFKSEIEKITIKINRYDIPDIDVPNPKLELCKKIEPLFDKITSALLNAKKQRIEETMLDDLNSTLVAYAGQIGKVELSENLADLTFKIYHKAGNEIYLEELNAASKQIIVQVLLKALHQFGDYNPPVMIDTVMGYLDEDSRASLLENYFPKLSHQTILLSTDSEIRTDKDLLKIDEFIAKKYILNRDKEKQLTTVKEGYFNA